MTVESRIFSVAEYVQPSEGEPIRSVVLETRDSIIVVWHVHPGQEIAAHIHPHGQDTWTVLSGMADYFQGNGIVRALREGEIAVARPGQVHGREIQVPSHLCSSRLWHQPMPVSYWLSDRAQSSGVGPMSGRGDR
jgi:quercetin dioxygenase-like cupin family protein